LTSYRSIFDYDYNAAGDLLSQWESRETPGQAAPDRFETTFEYDQSGRIRQATDAAGGTATTDYSFEAGQRKVVSTSRDGIQSTEFYDAAGRLVRQVNPYGGETSYRYDTAGNLTLETFTPHASDGSGITQRITQHQYDGLGRVVQTIQHGAAQDAGESIETTVAYHLPVDTVDGDWDVITTDPAGQVTKQKFDELGNLVAVRQGAATQGASNDTLTTYSYAYGIGLGLTTVETSTDFADPGVNSDPRKSKSVLNTRGDALEVYTYAENGFVLSQQNTYLQEGRLDTQIDLSSATDSTAYQTTYAYDFNRSGTGNVVRVGSRKHEVLYNYDSAGNLVAQLQRRIPTHENKYELFPDEVIQDLTLWTYDALGRILTEVSRAYLTGAEGETDNYAVVTRDWSYNDLTTTYTDRNGVAITSLMDPSTRTLTETANYANYYDAPFTQADTLTTTTSYYSDGSVRQVTDLWAGGTLAGDASTVSYTYDEFGRLYTTTTGFTNDSQNGPASRLTTTYHDNGARASAAWELDLAPTAPVSFLSVLTTDYTLDLRGRIKEVSQSVDTNNYNLWNGAGGPGDIEPINKSVKVAYTADGRPKVLERFDDASASTPRIGHTDYQYDEAGRTTLLAHLTEKVVSANTPSEQWDGLEEGDYYPIALYDNTYDANGRIATSDESTWVWDAPADSDDLQYDRMRHQLTEYRYDEQNHLVYAGPPKESDLTKTQPAITEVKRYDNAGNQLDGDSYVGYGNRLVKDAQFLYEYDRQGNLVKKTNHKTGAVFYTEYTWDHRGRLLEVRDIDGTGGAVTVLKQVEYGYDALGRQVVKQVTDNPATATEPTTHVAYVYDGAVRQFEIDLIGPDQISNSFFYGPTGDLLAIDAAANTYWVYSDASGVTQSAADYVEGATSDGDHWRIGHREIDSFGQPFAYKRDFRDLLLQFGDSGDKLVLGDSDAVDAISELPVNFQGGWWDADARLYSLSGRMYDPFNGRFVQDAGGQNGYALSPKAPNRDRALGPIIDTTSDWDTYMHYLNPANNGPGEGAFAAGKYIGWALFAVGSIGAGTLAGGGTLAAAGYSTTYAYGLAGSGALAGAANGALQTWASNPDAGFHEYAFGVGLGGGFGGLSPTGGFTGLGGSVAGGALGSQLGDARTGIQIGGFAGDLAGAGIDDAFLAIGKGASLRKAALHATGQTLVTGGIAGGVGAATYATTGDLNSALLAANIATLPANLAARRIVPCFPAGTPVLTPEGHTAIEDLRPGDLVLSRPETDNGTAPPSPQRVEEVFTREGRLFEVAIAGRPLPTTPEHPFFVEGQGWTPAGELTPGARVGTASGEWLAVTSVRDTGRSLTVYNFRVADHRTYFVGRPAWDFGVWVHNRYNPLRANLGLRRGDAEL
ncbi:MAG: hypothetical protein KDA37_15170, partial [Planctomycetales bacterium]|nr:hypothetical protein [Planctomycetales bacterium]